MLRLIKRIALPLSIAVVVLFLLFTANQLIAIYSNLLAVNETLAIAVTALIGGAMIALLGIPFVLFLRLPKSIEFDESDPENYKKQIVKRLEGNKIIKNAKIKLKSEENIEEAVKLLDAQADEIINETATSVFLTTAISQNGKLDALTVFITQSRMIWKVAHIYWQRPVIKDLIKLYANVGATSLIASEIENIDITRQIEPIINSIIKSPGRSIPFVGHAAHIITDSLLEGSTNAFLTLRVGIITQRYCSSTTPFKQKQIKNAAFVEASGRLRKLVLKSSGKVVSSVLKAIKNAGVNSVTSSVNSVKNKASKVSRSVGSWVKGGKTKDSQTKIDK